MPILIEAVDSVVFENKFLSLFHNLGLLDHYKLSNYFPGRYVNASWFFDRFNYFYKNRI